MTLRDNLGWGVRWGLSAAAFFSVWVTFVRMVSGSEPFDELGVSYSAVVVLYFVLGAAGGAVLGLLRRFVHTWHGAALIGWLIAFIVYSGVSVALGNPPWVWDPFMLIVVGIISFIVGVAGGVSHWRRFVRTPR